MLFFSSNYIFSNLRSRLWTRGRQGYVAVFVCQSWATQFAPCHHWKFKQCFSSLSSEFCSSLCFKHSLKFLSLPENTYRVEANLESSARLKLANIEERDGKMKGKNDGAKRESLSKTRQRGLLLTAHGSWSHVGDIIHRIDVCPGTKDINVS